MAHNVVSRIIADGLATGPFIATWGRAVTRWPLGVVANAQTLQAVVELDNESGVGNEGTGNLATRTTSRERISRTARLEVPMAQAIDDRDIFLLPDDEQGFSPLKWSVTRIEMSDEGMKTVFLERPEELSISRFRGR